MATKSFGESRKVTYGNLDSLNKDLRKLVPLGWYIESLIIQSPAKYLQIEWRRNGQVAAEEI